MIREVSAEIIGVSSVKKYRCCFLCNGKVNESTHLIGNCTKCYTSVKLSKCKLCIAANLVLDVDGRTEEVSAFSDVLKAFTRPDIKDESEDKIAEESLGCTEAYSVCIDRKNVMVSVN